MQRPRCRPPRPQLRTFRSFYEAHGTGRDSMLYGGAKANLAAGQALVHVAASVVSIAPPGTA